MCCEVFLKCISVHFATETVGAKLKHSEVIAAIRKERIDSYAVGKVRINRHAIDLDG